MNIQSNRGQNKSKARVLSTLHATTARKLLLTFGLVLGTYLALIPILHRLTL